MSLEEKIQIFEKFSKTGEELVGNTIFEGYPIGQWAIQIRNGLNRINNGKQSKQTINPTEGQLERLEVLGILERQIDSTIDEKIDRLVEWRRKYPKATVTPIVSSEILSEYAGAEEEQKQLIEEYEKMLRYYDYVRTRNSKGKLDENQIKKCRDGNVGGVFGENPEVTNVIKSETDKLTKKYGLSEETINSIRKQYGSIDEFRKIYIEALINQNVNQVIPKDLLKNANLIRGFDLSSPDWVIRNSGLTDLIYDILGGGLGEVSAGCIRDSGLDRKFINLISSEGNFFIKYGGLEEEFIKIIKEDNFTEDEEQALFMLYGLDGKEKVNKAQIARNIGKSSSRVSKIIEKSIKKMIRPSRIKQLDLKNRIPDIDYDLQKKIIEEYFKNFDIFASKEPTSMDEDVKIKLTNMLSEGIEKTKKRNELVNVINEMSKEQKLDILKARFGERINSSDISVVPHCSLGYSYFEETNGRDINEKLLGNWWWITDILYRECVDSECNKSKLVEFMINSFSNSQLIEVGKKEEIEELITNNGYFSEEKKNELKELLGKRIKVAVEEDVENKISYEIFDASIDSSPSLRMTIEDLDLTVRAYNCLKRAGIHTVQDFVGKTYEDIMNVRNLSEKNYDEVIKKLQLLRIEMVDGHFVNLDSDADIKKMRELEERINSSEYIGEEKKEKLRELLYQTFNVTIADNQEVQSDLEDIESTGALEELSKEGIESSESLEELSKDGIESSETLEELSKEDIESIGALEELSKEDLVKRILELQRTIAKQREEIDEMSSQKKEEINE